MLRDMGELAAAENVEWAVDEVLGGQSPHPRPRGLVATMEVAEAIAAMTTAWEPGPSLIPRR